MTHTPSKMTRPLNIEEERDRGKWGRKTVVGMTTKITRKSISVYYDWNEDDFSPEK